ncbi:MAG: DUF58 domain-containing protein [Acidimicrobiales bacterium]
MTSPSLAQPAEVLRRLELTITRRLDGVLHGDHRGLTPGHGFDPGDARLYVPGDDVRRIDWNVTARTQAPHVRDTIADRELETWLLLDLSASLDFGTADCEKRDLVLAAAAAVGFLTQRGGNRLGAVLLGGGGRAETVPARGGRDHLRAVLHRIVTAPRMEGAGAADFAGGLTRLDRSMRRRGLAVVISDWLDAFTPADVAQPLRRLGVRHDLLCVEVVDPRELELPNVGVLDFVDPETGRRREIQTSDAALRGRFAAAASARRAALAHAFRAAGADHLALRTDRDWLADIVTFATTRPARMAALVRARA